VLEETNHSSGRENASLGHVRVMCNCQEYRADPGSTQGRKVRLGVLAGTSFSLSLFQLNERVIKNSHIELNVRSVVTS
jgi:hypothetical protein